jgi:threonylcarbamoyladenosine tRNA methylthiotransferase MtaB
MTAPAPDIITFGCRLNTYESEVMRAHAAKAGLDDAIIVNTCAVTAEAVRQARQAIRRARRERPEARIVVTGCAAQIDPDVFVRMPEVDCVIGNEEKLHARTFEEIGRSGANEKVRVNDIMDVRETAGHLVAGFEGRTRAFVQVQNGCDHRCTFCIIPYGRGNARSVPAGAVVEQVRALVANAYREVVLTGVDITSYGSDLPGHPRLGNLVARVLKLVPELERLRLSSIDSVEADEALLTLMAEEPRLMPHLHLSLQSGDDMILKRMKRRHSRDDVIRLCADLRAARPDIVFGADIITGFPTETDEMFRNTLDLVRECELTWLHVFPFSPRPGTPAARMPQLKSAVIKERAAHLRVLGEAQVAAHLSARTGSYARVLMEREGEGRTEGFAPVTVTGPARPGEIIRVRLTTHDGSRFFGAVDTNSAAA